MISRDSEHYEQSFDEDDGRTIEADICPECEGDLRPEGGEISCTLCGLIVNDYQIDHGAEHRAYDAFEQPQERTGAPLTPSRHDRGLSSEIGYKRDANGNILSGAKRRQLSRLRRHHKRARWGSKAEQNLAHACGEIARVTSALDLTATVRDEACTIYRTAMTEDLIQGRSIEAMAAASVYGTCRVGAHERSLDDVAAVTAVSKFRVTHSYRVLNRELHLATKLRRPQTLVPQLTSACELPGRINYRARYLAKIAERTGIANGRKPAGVAAACLYQAAQERNHIVTQQEIAEAAGVTTPTLRKRYKELQEALEKDDHSLMIE